MMTHKSFWRYWWQVFVRAFVDTWGYLGHNKRKMLLAALVAFISPVVLLYVEDGAHALARVQTYYAACLTSVAVFVIALAVSFARTPWVIENEVVTQIKEDGVAMRTEMEKVRTQLHELTAKNALQVDQSKTLLIETKRWICAGNDLCKAVVDARPHSSHDPYISAELAVRAHTWMHQTQVFVANNAKWFLARLLTDDGIPSKPPLSDMQATQIRDRASNRVARLEELLDQLPRT